MSDEPTDINIHAQREAAHQLKELKDAELVQFIRDTVVRLEVLADRLDVVADKKDVNTGAGKHTRQGD